MWGTSSNYPSVNSYADAEREYNSTKPLRGRPDFRPLDARSSRAKTNIRKVGDDYIIQLYSTDIVTYYQNGDVALEGGNWSTQTTAAALSALSPFVCWCQKGQLVVAKGYDYYAEVKAPQFVLSRNGLLFKPNEAGVLTPVHPPVAVQRKKRVKRAEARAVRKFFKQVPVYIKAFSAAFEGGQPALDCERAGRARQDFDAGVVLSDERAARVAQAYLACSCDYITKAQTIVNLPDRAEATFWTDVYAQFDLVESYHIELPYGEVAK